MDNVSIAHFLIDGVFGVAFWFMQDAYARLKEDSKENAKEISELKKQAHLKEDFREFKQELWNRLDKMEDDFRRALETK